jgi:tetratricopeptide (TPR) repeat protein
MASNRFHRSFRVSISAAVAVAFVLLSRIGAEPIDAQSTPASAVLGRAAWDAIRSGRVDEAAETFRQAIAIDQRDGGLFLGAGLAAHLLGRTAEARRALEQALQIDPRLTNAALLLGEIAYRDGDLQSAIRTYEEALSRTPANSQLQDKLARWRREASLHDSFARRISDHFTVLFEGPPEQPTAELALQILEAAYWRIGASVSSYPSEPVTVVLYSQEQFRDITRSPQWAGGLFDGNIRVPVRGALERRDELQRVLTHEFTHALIWAVAPRVVPTWLNEGLAVLFEGEHLDWATRRLQSAHQRFALSDLHRPFSNLNAEQAAVAYAESGLAVHALVERIGGGGVGGLLQELARGTEFDAAFQRFALISYADFQNQRAEQ